MSSKLSFYAQAARLGLENSDQWIKDAKLLINNSSFGHANALLRFACEELAKSYLCWLCAEGILPIESKIVKDSFKKHGIKNKLILGFMFGVMLQNNHSQPTELSYQEILEMRKQFEAMVFGSEKMRQRAIYVDSIPDKKQIQTPLAITKKETNVVLEMAEFLHRTIRFCIKELPEDKIEEFKQTLKEAWETGEIPAEWFKERS